MKIKRIVVKNLFGTFDHEVPLNMEEQITILHGSAPKYKGQNKVNPIATIFDNLV
ncbi:isocitrate/isopropylmalate family dehydrogenase [Methanococcoides sp.]|jgi:isocitrate/isopropylmalate dehydrogenase|uniref:isocitrate/isopropylmalate family dehydrogenase n=1 Tax=Methanococcoides sp. TaxID=1966350 RepID=UPI00272EDC1F|nr:isocitrate/isopropylmalate family dehydrogenase [Methanococcoides sp.]